ncbi:MAG: hypothetical protein M3Q60_11770 [Actinomycetota bacterium]|nr:hypothetical protein [Actinomycetota bacterium]
MSDAKPHLKALEEIERTCVPGLVEVLRTEGIEGVRYALWDMTGWRRGYDPCVWRSRATEEQKRGGWEMWVRMEKIAAIVLQKAHERQVGEVTDALEERPEGLYGSAS